MTCVMSILLLTLVVRGHPRILALTACAPLSSQREQNYKRSPYSDASNAVRRIFRGGSADGYGALTGAVGVRPALFSEGQNYSVRRTQDIRIMCVMLS